MRNSKDIDLEEFMTEMKTNELMQYLTFDLAGESYAFDVLKTREVLNMVKVTPIPRTPDFMSGVINLRGNVVPVIDLRKKFDLPKKEFTIDTSIIIVEVKQNTETVIIGALVDSVKSVAKFDKGQTEPPPRIGMKFNENFIDAIAKNGDDFVILLNSDNVFSEEEMEEITGAIEKDLAKEAVR
jgi:purine-binding chemotaxis protein CheW